MSVHSRWDGNKLVFYDGAQDILEIDGANGQINVPTGAKFAIAGVDSTTSVAAGSVAGVAASYKLARGETALDGANPTPVATGLGTVISFVAMLKGAVAPGVGTSVLTSNITGAAGNVNVYGWKVTSNADPTLIASAGTESFYWVAVGTA
jgi:hypothetical protein